MAWAVCFGDNRHIDQSIDQSAIRAFELIFDFYPCAVTVHLDHFLTLTADKILCQHSFLKAAAFCLCRFHSSFTVFAKDFFLQNQNLCSFLLMRLKGGVCRCTDSLLALRKAMDETVAAADTCWGFARTSNHKFYLQIWSSNLVGKIPWNLREPYSRSQSVVISSQTTWWWLNFLPLCQLMAFNVILCVRVTWTN